MFMPSRSLLIGMIAASLTSGVALGMATPTEMNAAPGPEWRAAWRAINVAGLHYVSTDSGPVDLTPTMPVAVMRVAAWDERQALLALSPADLGPQSVGEPRAGVSHTDRQAATASNTEAANGVADNGLVDVPVVRLDKKALAADPFVSSDTGQSQPLALSEPANIASGES